LVQEPAPQQLLRESEVVELFVGRWLAPLSVRELVSLLLVRDDGRLDASFNARLTG